MSRSPMDQDMKTHIAFDIDIKILWGSKPSAKNRQDIYIAHCSRFIYYWHLSMVTDLKQNLRSIHQNKERNKS